MASVFAHIAIPAITCVALKSKSVSLRLFLLAALVSKLPDADVIGFDFDIPYSSQWGHRGFTHSIVFAVLIAGFCSLFKKQLRSNSLTVFIVCFISCLSHALLDAMTNGGLGVALYWPLSEERHFFSFRPIQVSPIGIKAFFTERGLRVIFSELVWVFLPCALLALVSIGVRRLYKQ